MERPAVRTLGVEEELLLFDAETGRSVALGDQIADDDPVGAAAAAGPGAEPVIDHELKLEQVETATAPCSSLQELRGELCGARTAAVARAAQVGAVVAAMGTSPLRTSPTTTPDERYERMLAAFGLVARQQLTCGMHVHVSIDSPDEGVAVLDRLRTWLPVILALSVNSPFWQGRDAGLASYRSVSWSAWPTAGPTELLGDHANYERVVSQVIENGAALDAGMIYFDARLSARYPTVEVRLADVCMLVDDALLVAALCRALVQTAAEQWSHGVPPPPVPRSVLRAASWQAARHGLSDTLYDGAALRPVPAADAVSSLLDHVHGALELAGDAQVVRQLAKELLERGTGAQRQRAVFARRGNVFDVVREAARLTAAVA